MNREKLADAISTLLALYGSESGYLEYKEGSQSDPSGNLDEAIALGWVTLTNQGGPWRRVEVSPQGIELVEQIFQITRIELTR